MGVIVVSKWQPFLHKLCAIPLPICKLHPNWCSTFTALSLNLYIINIYIPVVQGLEGNLNYLDTVLMLATFLTSQEQGLHWPAHHCLCIFGSAFQLALHPWLCSMTFLHISFVEPKNITLVICLHVFPRWNFDIFFTFSYQFSNFVFFWLIVLIKVSCNNQGKHLFCFIHPKHLPTC